MKLWHGRIYRQFAVGTGRRFLVGFLQEMLQITGGYEGRTNDRSRGAMVSGLAPSKSWERVADSSGPAPFKPPSSCSTSHAIEASDTAKLVEVAPIVGRNVTTTNNTLTSPVPLRPWQNYGTSHGGMYGGGKYNSGFGGPMGGYGMGMGGPYSNQDPNNPYGPPSSPPSFWMPFLHVAFHLFMTALLQLFDHPGLLYGEHARFVLRILGIHTRPRKEQQLEPPAEFPAPPGQHFPGGPKASDSWDSVWADDTKGSS